jgi:O-methyltransferase
MLCAGATTLKRTVQKALRQCGYELHSLPRHAQDRSYEPVSPLATYAPWNTDAAFAEVFITIRNHTLVDQYRAYELWSLVEQSRKLDGSLLEVGVWRGGTGAIIAQQAQRCGILNPVYLCDTFTGVVKAGRRDSDYRGGEHADTSPRIAEDLIGGRLKLDNVRILQGIFPEETAAAIAHERFRFCHIDVDVYASARDILDWVWPRLVVGGIVVYDDYGFAGCDGVRRHVEGHRLDHDRLLVHNLNGHAILIKIRA